MRADGLGRTTFVQYQANENFIIGDLFSKKLSAGEIDLFLKLSIATLITEVLLRSIELGDLLLLHATVHSQKFQRRDALKAYEAFE